MYPKNRLAQTLTALQGNIRVYPKGIPSAILNEFEQLSNPQPKQPNASAADLYEQLSGLFSQSAPDLREVQLLLVGLANSPDPAAFRYLQQLAALVPEETADFLACAQMQAQTRAEQSLTGESCYYISSPLGGEGDSLRYFWVISPLQPAEEAKKRFLTQEFEQYATREKLRVTNTQLLENAIIFELLSPFRLFLQGFLRKFLSQHDWLDPHYWLSNTQAPTPELIAAWLEKKKSKNHKL